MEQILHRKKTSEEEVKDILDRIDRFQMSLKVFDMSIRTHDMSRKEIESLLSALIYLVKNIAKKVRDLKKDSDLSELMQELPISRTLTSFFEKTYTYPDAERESGIKVNDIRIIETVYQGEKRLELFYGFFERYRLGEYISYLNKAVAIKLRDFLNSWIDKV